MVCIFCTLRQTREKASLGRQMLCEVQADFSERQKPSLKDGTGRELHCVLLFLGAEALKWCEEKQDRLR